MSSRSCFASETFYSTWASSTRWVLGVSCLVSWPRPKKGQWRTLIRRPESARGMDLLGPSTRAKRRKQTTYVGRRVCTRGHPVALQSTVFEFSSVGLYQCADIKFRPPRCNQIVREYGMMYFVPSDKLKVHLIP